MRTPTLFQAFPIALAALCLASCGGGAEPAAPSGSTGAETQSETQLEPGNDHAADLEARGVIELGRVTIAGATLELDASSAATAGETVTINVNLKDGPMPETIRMWYGIESGLGSMKVKADTHADHFHADVEIPASEMEGATYWLEAQTADGTKAIQSVTSGG